MQNQITWTATNGNEIAVTATNGNFEVSINGKYTFTGLMTGVPATIAAKAAAAGIVAFIGPAGLTADRRDALKAMQGAIRAIPTPALTEYVVLSNELAALHAKVEETQSRILRHDSNPAIAYAARDKAVTAYEAWKTAHPAYMAERAAQVAAEVESRAAERIAARIRFENAN